MLKYVFVKRRVRLRYIPPSLAVVCALCTDRIHMREPKRFHPTYKDCEKPKGTELEEPESINPVLFSKGLVDERLIVTR
jgi:hypothetical protein